MLQDCHSILVLQLCFNFLWRGSQGHIHVSYYPRRSHTTTGTSDLYDTVHEQTLEVSSVAYFQPWQTPWPFMDEYLNAGHVYYCDILALPEGDSSTTGSNISTTTETDAAAGKECLLLYVSPLEENTTLLQDAEDAMAQDEIYSEYLDALADDDDDDSYNHRRSLWSSNGNNHNVTDERLAVDEDKEIYLEYLDALADDDDDSYNRHRSSLDERITDEAFAAKLENEIEIEEGLNDPIVMIFPWTVDPTRDTNMTQLMVVMGQFMHRVQTTEADFVVLLVSGMDWKEKTLFWATGGLPNGLEMLMNPIMEDEALRLRDYYAGKSKYDDVYSLQSSSPFFFVVLDSDHGTSILRYRLQQKNRQCSISSLLNIFRFSHFLNEKRIPAESFERRAQSGEFRIRL